MPLPAPADSLFVSGFGSRRRSVFGFVWGSYEEIHPFQSASNLKGTHYGQSSDWSYCEPHSQRIPLQYRTEPNGQVLRPIKVQYPRHAWNLGVFFLASSFDRSMKKLEESLRFLQRNEEKLWFWGVDRSEDIAFSAEFLKDAGLTLDRRVEFPRKASSISLEPERDVPAFVLGPVRRGLAESVEYGRVRLAGD